MGRHANKLIESLLGKNLKSVFGKRSPSSRRKDRYLSLDFVFEGARVRVSCSADSDELVIERNKAPHRGVPVYEPEQGPAGKAMFAWLAANSRGYKDLFVLALGTAAPTIAVCAVAGDLALMTLTPASNATERRSRTKRATG